jgi:hypothetical protein
MTIDSKTPTIVTMTPVKATKNTVRFAETNEGKVVPTLYVPNETLTSLGWTEGQSIRLAVMVEGGS